MKITTEPQSIYVKAFGQTYTFGTVWLNDEGVICFSAGAPVQSQPKQFPGMTGLWDFARYIRLERNEIEIQLTNFANKVSK